MSRTSIAKQMEDLLFKRAQEGQSVTESDLQNRFTDEEIKLHIIKARRAATRRLQAHNINPEFA